MIIALPLKSFKKLSSHSRLMRSIWFVGSSSNIKSGSLSKSLPKASFER